MESVVLLWHIQRFDDGDEDSKLIGAYRSEQDAKAAIERLKGKPGFVDYPDGFFWESYRLNFEHWTEGFKFAKR